MIRQLSKEQKLEILVKHYPRIEEITQILKNHGFKLGIILSNGFTFRNYKYNIGVVITLGDIITKPRLSIISPGRKIDFNNYPLTMSLTELTSILFEFMED